MIQIWYIVDSTLLTHAIDCIDHNDTQYIVANEWKHEAPNYKNWSFWTTSEEKQNALTVESIHPLEPIHVLLFYISLLFYQCEKR